jgi:hypothetical protein
MKKILFPILCACAIVFTSCKKEEEDTPPTPTTPEVAVADENGIIERFTFDTNLNGTRRTGVAFTNLGTGADVATTTGKNRRNELNKALVVPRNGAVQVSGLPLPTGNAARSISCWVNFGASSNSRQFISYGTNTIGKTFGLSFNPTVFTTPITPSKIVGYTWGSAGYDAYYNFNPSITSNNNCDWVHLAVVYTGGTDNKLRLYVNGVLSEITPTGTINTEGTLLKIGGFLASSGSINGDMFMIDDVIIYNRAITQQEVTTLKNDTGCE